MSAGAVGNVSDHAKRVLHSAKAEPPPREHGGTLVSDGFNMHTLRRGAQSFQEPLRPHRRGNLSGFALFELYVPQEREKILEMVV